MPKYNLRRISFSLHVNLVTAEYEDYRLGRSYRHKLKMIKSPFFPNYISLSLIEVCTQRQLIQICILLSGPTFSMALDRVLLGLIDVSEARKPVLHIGRSISLFTQQRDQSRDTEIELFITGTRSRMLLLICICCFFISPLSFRTITRHCEGEGVLDNYVMTAFL